MVCPKCEAADLQCPECGKRYNHGDAAACEESACIKVNAPLDCVGCGLVASNALDGVLDYEMRLIKYRN
jgi:hypothetical protein